MEPSRGKSLCVPFESEEHYAACVAEPASFRQHLTAVVGQHPELFPARISEGFVLHDKRWSLKQQVMLRRLERKATAEVFLVRPSFLLPSMVGRTEAVEKALSLRHWGVPFDALVSVFGRDAMSWYRAEMALGRPAIVGSTVKQPETLPGHVLADEKHTWALGQEVSVPTTVGGGGILGATVAVGGLRRRAGGRLRRVCPGGARAFAHLQPQDGVHRRLGRHAERLEAPLPDGRYSPMLPPLGPQDRRTLWA